MKRYKISFVNYLYTNLLFCFILFLVSLLFGVIGVLLYMCFLLTSGMFFFLRKKDFIINEEGFVLVRNISKKKEIIAFNEIESINVVYKDYFFLSVKAIILSLKSKRNIVIRCGGIKELDEFEDEMYHVSAFLKSKFDNTFFTEFDLLDFLF